METILSAAITGLLAILSAVIIYKLNANERKRDKQEADKEAKRKAESERIERKLTELKADNTDIKKVLEQSKETDILILYDRIKYLCDSALSDGSISCDNRETILLLFGQYDEALKGNHGLADKVNQMKKLEIVYPVR